MIKQTESFWFDVPLELNEKLMMGVTSSEVYNTVYNITPTNNKLQILISDEQRIEHGVDIVLVKNRKSLYGSYNLEDQIITTSHCDNNKLNRKDFDQLKKNNWS